MAFFERRKPRRNIGVFGMIMGLIAILMVSLNLIIEGIVTGFIMLYPSISGILQRYYSKIPGAIGTIACLIAIGYGFFIIIGY